MLTTDSQYVRQGITQWIQGWVARQWRTRDGTDVKNQDLWRRLHALNQALRVDWHWVSARSGCEGNERADALAKQAIPRDEIAPPIDLKTLQKVVSGGQTGADRAGLKAACILGIETGGWAPTGFATANGNDPTLGTKFHLKELVVQDKSMFCGPKCDMLFIL